MHGYGESSEENWYRILLFCSVLSVITRRFLVERRTAFSHCQSQEIASLYYKQALLIWGCRSRIFASFQCTAPFSSSKCHTLAPTVVLHCLIIERKVRCANRQPDHRKLLLSTVSMVDVRGRAIFPIAVFLTSMSLRIESISFTSLTCSTPPLTYVSFLWWIPCYKKWWMTNCLF